MNRFQRIRLAGGGSERGTKCCGGRGLGGFAALRSRRDAGRYNKKGIPAGLVVRISAWLRIGFASLLVVGCASILTGCVTSKPQRPPVQDAGTSPLSAPISNTDPCAMQMHDITGAFLLFYASENRLPNQLSELYSTNFLERDVRFVCPTSQQPYVYNPGGIFMPEQNARVILYDATSAHSGFRWAITIHDPQPGQPLVAKVIALPDQFFILQH